MDKEAKERVKAVDDHILALLCDETAWEKEEGIDLPYGKIEIEHVSQVTVQKILALLESGMPNKEGQ